MIKVICEKCGAENMINKKEIGKVYYCLACQSFFFKLDSDGKILILEIVIT